MRKNIVFIFLALCLSACSKKGTPDTVSNVTQLSVYPGDERVKLTFAIEDENVQYCDIFWEGKAKSKRIARNEAVAGVVTTYIDNLTEGSQTFEVVAYDASGVPSKTTVRATSKVYGDTYRASIVNRSVDDLYFLYDKTPHIDWVASKSEEVAFDVNYTVTGGQSRQVRIESKDVRVLLPDYKENTDISYRALYLPVQNCIDTFVTPNAILPAPTIYASLVVKSLAERSGGFVDKIISQSVINLHEDVEYTKLQFENSNGSPFSIFVLKADAGKNRVSLSTLMPNNATSFGLQNVKTMVEHRNAAGGKVIAATNADYFDWSPVSGRPWGPVVVEGTVVKNFVKDGAGSSYFGVKKGGALAIGRAGTLSTNDYNSFQNLVGGASTLLLLNGVRQVYNDVVREPRTIIGYTADKVVYLIVVDGRRAGYSVGMTLDELGIMIGSLGVYLATNLDGGGSSTMVLKNDAGTFDIVNRYSDASPRAVANGLAIKLIE